jgi:thiaminase/transcriptional activator TenA
MALSMVKAIACTLVTSSWCVENSGGLSESLRLAAGKDWDVIVQDPFTDQLAAGTLPNATLTKYLVQDYRFLDAFVVLLASTIAVDEHVWGGTITWRDAEKQAAPSLQDRLPASRFLGLITSQENTYFERSFVAWGAASFFMLILSRLGVTEAEMGVADEPETKAFVDLMLKAARSGELVSVRSIPVHAS